MIANSLKKERKSNKRRKARLRFRQEARFLYVVSFLYLYLVFWGPNLFVYFCLPLARPFNIEKKKRLQVCWYIQYLRTSTPLPHSQGSVPPDTEVQAHAAARDWVGVPWCLLGVLGLLVLPQCVWSALHIHTGTGRE